MPGSNISAILIYLGAFILAVGIGFLIIYFYRKRFSAPSPPPPFSPTPFSPTPFSPTPFAPTPFSPTPFSPTPFSPKPVSPTPFSPTPFSPTPVSPTPVSPPSCPAFISVPGDIDCCSMTLPPSAPDFSKNTSESDCQKACQEYGCDWYNYSHKWQGCWLKKGNSNPGGGMGIMTGNSICPVYTVSGVSVPPGTYRTTSAGPLCQIECEEDGSCQLFDFDFTTLACNLKKTQDTDPPGDVITGFPI